MHHLKHAPTGQSFTWMIWQHAYTWHIKKRNGCKKTLLFLQPPFDCKSTTFFIIIKCISVFFHPPTCFLINDITNNVRNHAFGYEPQWTWNFEGLLLQKKERLIAANLFLCALPAEGILDVYNRLVDGIKWAHNQFCHYIRLSIFVLIYYRIVNTLIFLTIRVNDPSKPLVNDFQS